MNIRPILYVTGFLLCVLALGMTIPMLVDSYYQNNDWQIFFFCMMATSFIGGILVLGNAGEDNIILNIRQTFLLIITGWISVALFGAFPLWFCQLNLSFTDSFFESMSGVTATGTTIITNLDNAPPGVLIWRALLQWFGGLSIVVISMSAFPLLKIGGMQIFYAESSDRRGKPLPRTIKLINTMGVIYVFLTLACAISYYISGMGIFDSIAHAMTTLSTGGFSTFDSSFEKFKGSGTQIVAILFMLLGAFPFILYLKTLNGGMSVILKDSQIRWLLGIILISTACLFLYLSLYTDIPPQNALLESTFHVVSQITGTGFSTSDFTIWGDVAISFLFFLMVIGGCAGSTTGGIKIFRFQILYSITSAQIKKLLHPHGIFLPDYNKNALPEEIPSAVMGFFFVYALGFTILAAFLSFTGLDLLTSLSGAIAAISNAGTGFGDIIGPFRTYKDIPDSAKWALSAGMLFGRLELFTLLVLFSSDFWKK